MMSFNLITEPWIPCLDFHLQFALLSIRELLTHAHQYREIRDQSPLVTLTLYRFLLALIHRVWQGPEDHKEWQQYYEMGRFDWDPFDQYFMGTDTNGIPLQKRFDLFGEYPFYQDASLSSLMPSKERTPITALTRELSSTTNKVLFDHNMDNQPRSFSNAECARVLLARQYFAIPDGSGYKTAPLANGLVVLYGGQNLFEILLNNLTIYSSSIPLPKLREDLPLWETNIPKQDGLPNGYVSYLTWPYRRILFDSQDRDPSTGEIRYVYMKSGPEPLKEWQKNNPDPMIFYKPNQESGYISISLDREKAIWRDAHSFVRLAQYQKTFRPGVFTVEQKESTPLIIDCFGVDNKNNQIFIWRHECMPIPSEYLFEPEVLTILETAIRNAEKVESVLNQSIRELALRLLAPSYKDNASIDQKRLKILIKSFPARIFYWSSLESDFHSFYLVFPHEREQALTRWEKFLQNIARKSLDQTIQGLDGSARSLQAAVFARKKLNLELSQLFPHKEVSHHA